MINKKILLSAFCAGLLLIGLGSGVVFAEMSSFKYAGEKQLDPKPSQAVYTLNVTPEAKKILVCTSNIPHNQVTIKDNQALTQSSIIFELSYADNAAVPYESFYGFQEDTETITYSLGCSYHENPEKIGTALKYKDEVLRALKEKRIYTLNPLATLTIKTNPEIAKLIQLQ